MTSPISIHSKHLVDQALPLSMPLPEPNGTEFSKLFRDMIQLGAQSDSTQNSESSDESTLDSAKLGPEDDKLREAFHNFVGQTFFNQMLSSLRSTQQGAAYFNGGQAEKIFQGQLDQVFSEQLTKSSADQIADPMFKLFQLQRSS